MDTQLGASLAELAQRIDRLESTDQIRQIAAKYALALDMRDADAWVGLFPEDVQVTDINKPPIGGRKMRWPGREPYEGNFHDLFPSWREFWDKGPQTAGPVAEPAPLDQFIERMRRGQKPPSVRVR